MLNETNEFVETYYKRNTKGVVRFSTSFGSCSAKQRATFFVFAYIKFYKKMLNKVKFGWWANKSNRVRFYGKTVIDGKAITSKKYRDALSAIAWGESQLNRDCTCIYCITVSGAHVPMNVQFI